MSRRKIGEWIVLAIGTGIYFLGHIHLSTLLLPLYRDLPAAYPAISALQGIAVGLFFALWGLFLSLGGHTKSLEDRISRLEAQIAATQQ